MVLINSVIYFYWFGYLRGGEASLAYRFFETYQYNLSANKEIRYKEDINHRALSDWCLRELDARYYNPNNIRAVWRCQNIPNDALTEKCPSACIGPRYLPYSAIIFLSLFIS